MTLVIAGDIGGTKTILRLVKTKEGSDIESLAEQTYRSQDYPDLVPIVEDFLAGDRPRPEAACFAIAGPVVEQTSQLTNLSWSLEAITLKARLGIPKVSLINDFAAVSYGVLGLDPRQDLHTLQNVDSRPSSPIAIVGAGTGLGQGFLIPQGAGQYQVFASEGGHTDFAPRNSLEWGLLEYLREQKQINRVSVERVVSGQGIVSIYQYLRDSQFAPETPEIGQNIRTWERDFPTTPIDPGAIISRAAAEGGDRLCTQAMQMFIEAYAAEAGNLCLKLLPYGGLYIAGGIAAKILPLIEASNFLPILKQKGRVSSVLDRVPIHIVLNSRVGLLGSVLYALRE